MMQVKPVATSEAAPSVPDLDPTRIFRQEFSYVWCTLRRLGVFDRDLEDLAHEVFIRVNAQLALYDSTRPLRPWIFGIALGVASNYRRLLRHQVRLVAEVPEEVDSIGGADERLEEAERRALVYAALQGVPLERRAVLVLHEIDGYSVPEVAAALGIGINTAYSRLRLGREAFRERARRLMQRGDIR
jgi:RNA polymerase sigma-70 factor (ECF subfamily)